MTITSKNLYAGVLTGSMADILAPSGKTLNVVNIEIHNSYTAAETVTLAIQKSSTDYDILNIEVAAKDTVHIEYPCEYLESTMKLRGYTTPNDGDVNIVISGFEIT